MCVYAGCLLCDLLVVGSDLLVGLAFDGLGLVNWFYFD